MKSIRIGVLGAGKRSRVVLSHLLLQDKDKNLEVSGIWDPDAEAISNWKGRLGIDPTEYTDPESLINDSSLSWIFVGSPNSFHAEQAIAALNAGKDVFCEKPLAMSLEDCLAIRDAVERSGRKFVFGLVMRYSPHYQKMAELVHSGAIGRVISLEFNETLHIGLGGYIFGNWRRSRSRSGTFLLEKCCHDLDIANWLVGSLPVTAASFGGKDFFVEKNSELVDRLGRSPEGARAYSTVEDRHGVGPFSAGSDIVDNQVAIIEYANDVRATFHTNCNTAIPERRFYICGTEGTLRADMKFAQIELQKIGFDTKKELIPTHHSDEHAGGDSELGRGLYQTMMYDATPQASIMEGLCSAISAFGIDEAMFSRSVVDLRPMWREAGIDPGESRRLVPADSFHTNGIALA